ncbi:hypothetical protein RJ639_018297 [Escallonia herrerae]|uniref:Uncharacterized protein n=1 Tax=Escallonia herrerae TaxID=1293975 RepID=A0AA89AH08_9ASTE|nr:hypothetical protein RJ639_018297 [Escallonia herrerae]
MITEVIHGSSSISLPVIRNLVYFLTSGIRAEVHSRLKAPCNGAKYFDELMEDEDASCSNSVRVVEGVKRETRASLYDVC